MNTLSKEFVAETKKEIQRLEGLVRTYENRIEALQELLRDNSGHESPPKASSRKKPASSPDTDSLKMSEAALLGESEHNKIANA